MNETLIYTDTRPRARSTGHAFGFEGNLGVPMIISGMLSIFLLTMLFERRYPRAIQTCEITLSRFCPLA
jgi:hypothetical protein